MAQSSPNTVALFGHSLEFPGALASARFRWSPRSLLPPSQMSGAVPAKSILPGTTGFEAGVLPDAGESGPPGPTSWGLPDVEPSPSLFFGGFVGGGTFFAGPLSSGAPGFGSSAGAFFGPPPGGVSSLPASGVSITVRVWSAWASLFLPWSVSAQTTARMLRVPAVSGVTPMRSPFPRSVLASTSNHRIISFSEGFPSPSNTRDRVAVSPFFTWDGPSMCTESGVFAAPFSRVMGGMLS